MARHPAVLRVEADGIAVPTGHIVPNNPDFGEQDAIQKVEAQGAWDVTTGSADVIIAVIDSGVDPTRVDLAANLLPGYDFVDGDADPTDLHGHGTMMTGILVAVGNNNEGIAGLCWTCRILPLRVVNAIGIASTPHTAQATPGLVTDSALCPGRVRGMVICLPRSGWEVSG